MKDSDELDAQLAQAEPWSAYRERADRMDKSFGRTDRYKTAWPEFNTFLGGGFGSAEDGELVVVMGDTGVGKSTFVANLAVHIVINSPENIHYITLENSPESVYNLVRRVSGRAELGDLEKRFTSPPKYLIFGKIGWNADSLLRHMEYIVRTRGTKVFVLDHLNFMFENEDQLGNEIARTRTVMKRLSNFCNENCATVFAVSHINKKPETKSKTPKYLTLDRIYGSNGIAGSATKVLALNPMEGASRLVDLQMLKTRSTEDRKGSVAQFQVVGYEWRFVGTSLL